MSEEEAQAVTEPAGEASPSREERYAELLGEQVKWCILRDRWQRSMITNGGLAGLGVVLTVGGMLLSQGGFIVFVGAILYGFARYANARSKYRTCCKVLERIRGQLAAADAEAAEVSA